MKIDLGEVGLTGPYQVHVSPVRLDIDGRAHQVFVGFPFLAASDSPELKSWVGHRVWVSEAGQWSEREFSATISGDAVIFPACEESEYVGLGGLVRIVDRLLGPGGCPWDQAQTHESLKKHLIEECYELIEAIDEQDLVAMREELGDVMLQPIMHSQMAAGSGEFNSFEVATQIGEKLIRRHPHVFGEVEAEDEAAVLQNWDAIKRAEKGELPRSALAGLPSGMPSLLRALEVSKRAARLGFEWEEFEHVWDKFHEEEQELRAALASGDISNIESEFGDLLFTVVNLARWVKVDPEEALRKMLNRFSRRFECMERMSSQPLNDLNPEQWEDLWRIAKIEVG